jgi:nitrogen PTS system EIIA component
MDVGDKLAAITALANCLHATGNLSRDAVEEVIAAVARREEFGPTGIGGGLAVPHANHASLSQIVGAVGYSPAGIDFQSLDGRPVHTVVLVLSPPGNPREHLRALEQISRHHRRA